MEDEVYEKLAQWLVTTYRALPGVNGPELQEILHALYTPEEAQLALDMGPAGCTLDDLATKTGKPKDDLISLIRNMEKKGTIFTEPDSDYPLYRPWGMESPGLYETSAGWGGDVNSPFGEKMLELWGKFKPIYINEGFGATAKHNVAWCMVSALPPDAALEENLFAMIKPDVDAAVFSCPCRLMERHVQDGDVCDCITDCCMVFGELARWAIKQGHARRVPRKELIAILEACEKKGQVHTGNPSLILCNCCKHACVNFYAQKFGKTHIYWPNHFFARLDPDSCVSCGICVDRCHVGAIQMGDTAVIDQGKCIGCGACATGCSTGAIQMIRYSPEKIAKIDADLLKGFGRMFTEVTVDPLIIKLATGNS